MSGAPTPDSIAQLKTILPIMGEALVYCINQAVEDNEPGCVTYSARTDTLTYHKSLTDLDRALFEHLSGMTDIWIEVDARVES